MRFGELDEEKECLGGVMGDSSRRGEGDHKPSCGGETKAASQTELGLSCI